jgi:dethiobiotin synthetase
MSERILNELFEMTGRLAGQNELILAEQHRVRQEAAKIAENTQALAQAVGAVGARVDVMEPVVSKMAAFRAQISLAVVLVTGIVTGAINIIWLAISHFKEIGDALRDLLR